MRVAIVHYWLVTMRGGEKVLEALAELYPEADIYTNVVDKAKLSPSLLSHTIYATFINRLPRAKSWYQRYLPLMPLALEQLDLRSYDLVISSESGPAKGVITRPDALHVCYCHSPMRYIWDFYPEYLKGKGYFTKRAMQLSFHYMRLWDVASAARVDYFIANSAYVAARIQKCYRRDSTIIHPPVDVEAFSPSEEVGDYYLWLGQLVGYKRPDLAVEAFNASGRKLVILGEGEEKERLIKQAKPNIQFLGRCGDSEIQNMLSHCKALIFPGLEDFGIVPVEAMAAGRPVIAFNKGGAAETVIDGKTGILFAEQTVESFNEALDRYEANQDNFVPKTIQQHARNFSRSVFKQSIRRFMEEKLGK